jgi:RNA polymerase sigma factor (sigma-70 family)
MERAELERELEALHAESWGWALACCARDRELAEDSLQAAYLRVLSGRARFDGRSSVRTWVFGVIRVTAMEEARRRRSWAARHTGAKSPVDATDPSPGADAMVESSEQRARLVDALAAMSPRQREVLQLVFYHDMTIEEAAKVMQVSLGSARTHYERGKKALAQRLADWVTGGR